MNIFKSGTNTIPKVVSVLAALLLWFHVTGGSMFTTTVSVPIRYVMPARGSMVASRIPETVSVLVRGTGRALIAYNVRDITHQNRQYVLVNLSGLSTGRHQITITRGQILLGTEGIGVESILENGEFEVVIDTKARRSVPVDVDSIPGLVVAKDVAIIGKPSAIPSRVFVEGPAQTVRAISSVPVKSLAENRVSLSDTVLTALLDTGFRPFVTVDPQKVKLHFAVEPLLERTLGGVPLHLRGFPWKKRFGAEPDSVTVTITGPKSLIERITVKDIIASVPYASFLQRLENGDDTVTPMVRCPKGIIETSVSPEMIRIVPRGK